MASKQPFLHNLSGVFCAPVQAWADTDGQIRGAGAEGVYCGDDRVLSRSVLTVDGLEPEWVSVQAPSALRTDYLAFIRTQTDVADPLLALRRSRTAAAAGDGGEVAEALRIESALAESVRLRIQVELQADHSSIEQVKSGTTATSTVEPSGPHWHWRDDETLASLAAPEAVIDYDGSHILLTWSVTVDPGAVVELGWKISLSDAGAPMVAAETPPLTAPALIAGDQRIERLIRQSFSDLNSLRMADRSQPRDVFLAAGAPWFFTMFGRDSLIAARMLLPVDVTLAAGTLRALAARQGTVSDPATAEQPGKILHEVRRTTLTLAEGDGGIRLPPVYFGTIDATPLWICLLHDAWRAGMPDQEVQALLPQLEAALAWLRDYGDSDGDGFLEYLDTSGHGLANQGWKDSGDSIRWHDGSLAKGPIALSEVQAYAYEAALCGAELLDALGHPGSGEWRAYAADMALRFREKFWCEDEFGPFPAIALDADKVPVDGVTSNMGHLLGTGLLNTAEQEAVVRRLMDPQLFSGYGIRTVSTGNGGFWPTRYHAGSVWSHDTAIIIHGMLRDGFTAEAHRLAEGLLRAAEGFNYRLPELFAGHPAEDTWPPVPYPASCRPQAWAAASALPIAAALGALGAPGGVDRLQTAP